MALINKLSTALQKEAKELASKAGITLEQAAEDIIEREGQKAFGLTAKPTIEDFPTDPARFLGKVDPKENRSLRETFATPGVEESITAREASKFKGFESETESPLSKALRESKEGRTSSKFKKLASKEKKISPSKVGSIYSEPIGPSRPVQLRRTEESPSEDFAAGLEDLDTGIYTNLFSPKGKRIAAGAAGIAGAGGLAQALREDSASTEKPAESVPKEIEKLPTPELKKNIKNQLAEVDKIIKEPPPAALPEEIDRFKQQRDEAYQLFKEARDRNDWLQLAQILGQAFTQYGAAQVGMKTGRSMAGLQIPGIDYEARTAQEQKLLESRLRDVREEQEREDTLARRLKQEQREQAADLRAERELQLKEREARQIKQSPEEKEAKAQEKTTYNQNVKSFKNLIAAQAILADKNTTKEQKATAQARVAAESGRLGDLVDLDIVREASPATNLFGRKSGVDEKKVLNNFKTILNEYVKSKSSAGQKEQTSDTMTAPAGPPPILSAEDKEALKWATSNPNDPRAAEIRKRLGR